ncbi:GNAT family N-acetyltransferase [Actinocrispum sp. NPDC049592]|uniref:GNAT family N-acetyltransferase n=1 Tax=Actinocrispum sp. NPDC049592 TaxID=3154835 RepID=UPI003428F3EB
MPEVSMLPVSAADDAELMSTLADLVNKVYAVAEQGLWIDGAERTNAAELAGLTRAGQIAVARVDGAIAGSVRIQDLGDGLSEFGMLAAAPEHRGIGVGRELVRFAEQRNPGRTMQLELLVPREWSHPSKEFLAGWYGRIGYELVRVGRLDEFYPALTPLLATACDLRVYHKALGAPPRDESGTAKLG